MYTMNMNMTTDSNVIDYCKNKNKNKTCVSAEYKRLVTGGNNPTITKKMQCSQNVKTSSVTYMSASDYIAQYGV